MQAKKAAQICNGGGFTCFFHGEVERKGDIVGFLWDNLS